MPNSMIVRPQTPSQNHELRVVENVTPAQILDVKALSQIPDYLFGDAAGGIFVAGDSGTGKSSLLAAFAHLFARKGMGFSLYDPAGDLYRLVKNICLDLGPSVRRRTYLISPAGMDDLCFSIRPLFVDGTNLSPDEYEARLARRVSIASRILLTAFGDLNNFDAKPLLAKWVTRVLEAAAALGLSFVDAELFLQVGSQMFDALVAAVPDVIARLEFRELATMRPVERENFIASTKNRFLGLLKNPLVRRLLCGRTNPAVSTQARTIAELIKQNSILLWDLSPHGKLRPEDQLVLCQTALAEAMDAIENFEEHERTPHVLMLDELPTFLACPATNEQLTHLLRTCRKTKLRCIGAAQGVNFFPEKTEDRALHAFIGQAGTQFYFRMKDPLDAKFFAEIVKLTTIGNDIHTPKHILTQGVQYQDGFDEFILVDEGENVSSTNGVGGGETRGTNRQRNWQNTLTNGTTTTVADTTGQANAQADTRNHQTTRTTTKTMDTLRNAVATAEAKASGSGSTNTTTNTSGHTDANATQESHASGRGGAVGEHQDVSRNWTKQQQHGTSKTYKQTLVPHMEWREVVQNVQFYTPEEIHLMAASDIAIQPVGRCIMYNAGKLPVSVQVALVPDPFRLTPKFLAKQEAAFLSL